MRAAVYCRYSSENQRQESIEAQLMAIEKYARENDIEIINTYIDEAKSATTDQRPSFQQMIKDSDQRVFDAIIVHKLDRFARDRYDSVFYRRKLKNNGVNLISITEKLDGSPESVIMESLLEGMSEYYSRNLSREAMKGLMQNAYKCLCTGGKPPFGYDVDPLTKEYRINQEEAIAVKRIFSDYAEGKSYKDIITWLNNNGYRTKKGGKFVNTSLHSLLNNEKYIGIYIFNKNSRSKFGQSETEIVRIENGVPAIVSLETFNKVQFKLERNKVSSQVFKAVELYLLSGKIFCGKCGGKMFGNRRTSKSGSIWSGYQCSTRKKEKSCDMSEIKKDKIETLVLNHLEREIFTDDFINDLAADIMVKYDEQTSNSDQEESVFLKRLSDIQKQIDNIVSAVMDGFSSPALKNRLDELELSKNEVSNMIAQIKLRATMEISLEDIKKYLSIGKGIAGKTPDEQIQIISTFVEKVVVHDETVDICFYIDKLKKKRGYIGAPCSYSFVSTLDK